MESKIYHKIFAFVFLLLLFGFSSFNLYMTREKTAEEIRQLEPQSITWKTAKGFTADVDSILSLGLFGDHTWNEVFGATYRLLGKNEENNFAYVRDKNGMLYYANLWNTTDVSMHELAKRVKRMQDDLSVNGTRVIMLLYPTKYDSRWSDGYYGIPYQDMNALADEYLQYLRRYNIDYIDYRQVFLETGKSATEVFFKYDHHWNVPTAFFATQVLVDHIRDTYGDDLDPKRFYCDISHYVTDTYASVYMGSQGRETGEIYAGLEDYTFITPRFDSKISWRYVNRSGKTGTTSGRIEDALITRKYLDEKDVYEREMNNSYINGVYMLDEIENALAKNSTDVLFLRNSFSSTVAVFLTPMVRSIDMMWTVNMPEDTLMAGIRHKKYDYVFVALNVDNLADEEFSFYTKNEDDQTKEEESDGETE